MFVDIEAVEFFFFGDAETYGFIDDGEYDDCHYEDVATVERTPITWVLRVYSGEKTPTRILPVKPHTPWTLIAPTGSSILATLSKNSTENTTRRRR